MPAAHRFGGLAGAGTQLENDELEKKIASANSKSDPIGKTETRLPRSFAIVWAGMTMRMSTLRAVLPSGSAVITAVFAPGGAGDVDQRLRGRG